MKATILLVTFILVSAIAFTQSGADRVVGKWRTADSKGIFQIYKASDGTYQGKIIATANKPGENSAPLDKNNPDPAKRNRPLAGMVIMTNFKYDGEIWKDGKIYNPKDGKEYSCKMWLEDNNTLKLRGYVGISLLGKTEIWYRIE